MDKTILNLNNTNIKARLFVIAVLILYATLLDAQQCLNCDPNSNASGDYSTALGNETIASNNASFACGVYSIAQGTASISLGGWNLSENQFSTTIGTYCHASANNSIVIGHGVSENDKLINPYSYSLMMGFGSTRPTLFVSMSPGSSRTGKIGIGNITAPEAKLHLLADQGEEAAIFIQPQSWAEGDMASIALGSKSSGITASKAEGMSFLSEGDYIFNSGGKVGINNLQPQYDLDVDGSIFTRGFRLYDDKLPPKSGYVLASDDIGNAYWTIPTQFSLWSLKENELDIYRSEGKVIIGGELDTPEGYRILLH